MPQKYFDIIPASRQAHQKTPKLRQKLSRHFRAQKKWLRLRWEFLDLSLSGVLVYGLIIILAFGGAVLTSRLISTAKTKPVLEIAPSFSDFKVETNSSPATSNPSTDKQKINSKTQPISEPTRDPFSFIQNQTPTHQEEKKAPSKDSFRIRILNGNGKLGAAAQTKNQLQKDGFQVGSIGNARHRYSKTQIYYLEGKKEAAQLVAQNLNFTSQLHQSDHQLIGKEYDILIVLGQK